MHEAVRFRDNGLYAEVNKLLTWVPEVSKWFIVTKWTIRFINKIMELIFTSHELFKN